MKLLRKATLIPIAPYIRNKPAPIPGGHTLEAPGIEMWAGDWITSLRHLT